MKIVVCGDSFMSADANRLGTHFSELLINYGHTVTNLARGGISNTGIAFQIETASNLQPDLILFSSTGHDRIDIVIDNKKFYAGKGLKNFIYPYQSDSSTGNQYVGGLDATILSDVIPAFLDPRPDLPTQLQDPNRANLVKQYLALFHSYELQKVLDAWILGFWKYKLKEQQIPFIHLEPGGKVGQHMYSYVNKNPSKINQCVYHTDEQTQIFIANEIIIEIARLKIL